MLSRLNLHNTAVHRFSTNPVCQRTVKDAEGKPVVQDMIANAKESGSGQVDYLWLNRSNNKVEHKSSYVVRTGDYIVGAGAYTP